VHLPKTEGVLIIAAVLLAGCSVSTDSIWPTTSGPDPKSPPPEQVQIAQSEAERSAQPTMSPPPQQAAPATMASAPTPASLEPTGTFVGDKVTTLRGELDRLKVALNRHNNNLQQIRVGITQNAQRYHGTVAAITARLQLGTTPGNPILVGQWNAAQIELDRVSNDIGTLNTLANSIAADSSLAAFVLESARAAYSLTGAIDEDHRQLALLEDDTNRTVVLIDRLLSEVNEDVARQTAYVANERANLTTLSAAIKNGELHGSSLLARAYATGAPPIAFSTSSTPRSGFTSSGRSALVVIRFDRADVPYERALYTALSKALEARPGANFDLVGVAAGGEGSSDIALNQSRVKKHANDVLKALVDMGLPPSRVSLAATTSPTITTNEVHLYLR